MPFMVEDAIAIATKAHQGQRDKSGHAYIGHPLRVMGMMHTDHERMTAVLHDVVEDTEVTADALREAGCPDVVVEAVVAISKRPGEAHEDYLERVAANPMALAVKRADIADNSSPVRMAELDGPTRSRLREKYAKATRLLDAYARG